MPKPSLQEKKIKHSRKLSVWIAFILFIGFTAAGLVRIFFTGDSIGVNSTRLQVQVKSGLQYVISGALFLIACFINWKTDRKSSRRSNRDTGR